MHLNLIKIFWQHLSSSNEMYPRAYSVFKLWEIEKEIILSGFILNPWSNNVFRGNLDLLKNCKIKKMSF